MTRNAFTRDAASHRKDAVHMRMNRSVAGMRRSFPWICDAACLNWRRRHGLSARTDDAPLSLRSWTSSVCVGRKPSSALWRRADPGLLPCQKSNGKAPFGESMKREPAGDRTRMSSPTKAKRWKRWSGNGVAEYVGGRVSVTPICSITPELRTMSK